MGKVFEYTADLKIEGSADYAGFDGQLETIRRYEGDVQLYVVTAAGEVALGNDALLDVNRDGLGDPYVRDYQQQKMGAADEGYLFVYRGTTGAPEDHVFSVKSLMCNAADPIEAMDTPINDGGGYQLVPVLMVRSHTP